MYAMLGYSKDPPSSSFLLLPSPSFSFLRFLFFFFFLKRQKKKIVGRGPTAHIWTEYIHNDDGKTLISGVLPFPRFLFLFLYLFIDIAKRTIGNTHDISHRDTG